MGHRVVSWTPDGADAVAAQAVMDHPALELVGLLTHGAGDATALAESETLSVTVTHDLETLLALIPDCILYGGGPPTDQVLPQLVRILRSGANVVCSSSLVPADAKDRERFLAEVGAAAEEGASSFLAAGDGAEGAGAMIALVNAVTAVCRARPGVLAACDVGPEGPARPSGTMW